jgi:putative chitinase
MDISELQIALNLAGYDPGPIDGGLGAQTYAALIGYTVEQPINAAFKALGTGFAQSFATYEINSTLRIAHWIGQAAHETGKFVYLTELGGDAYFTKYDGRADLGNTQPGDGARFRGRGLFQITGRANYAKYGADLKIDLVDDPARAADPDVATETACLFWNDHDLNTLADADDGTGITRKINGGVNGLADRLAFTARIKAVWS